MHRPFTILLGAALFASASLADDSENPEYGFRPYANTTLEGWSLLEGGAGSGERGGGLLDVGADFTLSSNTEGHVNILIYEGNRAVDTYTGDFGVFSNIISDTQALIYTAWLQHEWGEHSQIRYGQLAADDSFQLSHGGSLFLNANFGPLPTLSANVSAPLYSVASAGIELISNSESGYSQLGVYAGDPGPGDKDDHGFNWNAGGDAGYFFIAEKGWQFHSKADGDGVFKIGAHHHSGRFDSLLDSSSNSGLTAFYAIVDYPITESIHGFVRAGYNSDSEYTSVSRYFDLGAHWIAPLDQRPDDVLGIAYARTQFTDGFNRSAFLDSNQRIDSEHVIELTYSAPLFDRWDVQPSFQWIINPLNASEDAFLAGIRISTSL